MKMLTYRVRLQGSETKNTVEVEADWGAKAAKKRASVGLYTEVVAVEDCEGAVLYGSVEKGDPSR